MDEYSNYAEHIVECKKEGKFKRERLIYNLAYLFLLIVSIVLFCVLFQGFFPLLLVVFILIFTTYFIFKRYLYAEYFYKISKGVMTFVLVRGRKKGKKVIEVAVKDMELIAPMTDEYKEKYQSADIKKVYNCLGTKKSPDAHFILFTDAKGEKSVIYFEAISKALAIMKFYNSQATVINSNSRV